MTDPSRLQPRVVVTPVSMPKTKQMKSVGTALYFGMRILSSPVMVKSPVPSVINQSQLDADFMAEVLQEKSATLEALEKHVTTTREFHLVSRQPLIYVHVFTDEEMSANPNVSIAVWDKFAQISCGSVPFSLPEAEVLSIDFRPLIMDNVGLQEEGFTSTEFNDVLSGKTPSIDCKEYTYEIEHGGINWDERVWTSRLYWTLKKKEGDLHVNVFNVSQDGPHWETTLADLLNTSKAALNATPFKGVTDILLVGKTSSVSVFVRNDETDETSWIVGKRVGCGAVLVELGLGAPVRIHCPNYQGKLPKKLGELLSSMYLVGVARSLSKPEHGRVVDAKIYGWLILRPQFMMGVELKVSSEKPEVTIMFVSSNFNRISYYFTCLYKCIS